MKSIERVPQDFKEKVSLFIDKQVMPFFYALNFKYDLKTIGAWILILLCLGSLLVSIQPLIEVNHQSLINELGLRAKFIAKQIVAKNAPFLATKTDISTDIGSLEKSEKDVRMAILVDLENRILAPTNRMNQYLVSGEEAKIAIQTRNRFLSGREEGVIIEATNHNVVAIEPVKIFNPRLNKNVVIAMAIVSIDSLQSLPSLGDVGLFYSKAIVLNGLLFIIAFLVLYFSTLKPFQVLNDDIDKVLKGDMNQVTKEFKITELSSLWDNINSALQRVPRSTMTTSGADNMSFQGTLSSADCVAPFEVIGGISKHGIVVCDSEKKILYFNQVFEEISGLRIEQVKGETLMSAGRDQAFLALCQDMFSKVVSGGPSIQEEFEFSGVLFGIYLIAMGAAGTAPKCYVFIIEKKEGA
ncbi:MAG: PAS domain S-box protein [Deltaproteobacteria bacterium]|nr:PAS domain S-box protein [Deltaproteobacteria bacterium]